MNSFRVQRHHSLCFLVTFASLVPLGCHPNDSKTANVAIGLPKPSAQLAPDDWPNPLVLVDKSWQKTEHEPTEFYNSGYRSGWNDYMLEVIRDPDCDLDIPFPCVSGYAHEAILNGYHDCRATMNRFEKQHGRSTLVKLINEHFDIPPIQGSTNHSNVMK